MRAARVHRFAVQDETARHGARDAERSVIGALLLHPRILAEVRDALRAEDFADDAHRAIYGAIVTLDAMGTPVDALTVADEMRKADTFMMLRHLGGSEFLTELIAGVVTVENIAFHARLVSSNGARRRLGAEFTALARAAFADEDVAALVERGQRVLDDERARRTTGTDSVTTPIAEFLGNEEQDDERDEWLVGGLLPRGVVAFLAGLPKAKKTWIAILLAVGVAAGRRILDRFDCRQGPVLLVTEEDTATQLRRRLWWVARGLELDPIGLPIRVSALRGFRLDEAPRLNQLEREAQGAALIVFDALTRIHGLDENSRTDMQAVTQALQGLAARTAATVLVVHHMRKQSPGIGDRERAGQRMRGTGDLHALARAIIAAEKLDNGSIGLSAESNYGCDVDRFAVALSIEPPIDQPVVPGQKRVALFRYLGEAKAADASQANAAVLAALKSAPEPVTARELRDSVSLQGALVDAARDRLNRAGTILLVRYKPAQKRQASDRWVLASRACEFEAAES